MDQKKKELTILIESIQDEQVLDYLLSFAHSFSDMYEPSTSLLEIGAGT